MQCEEESLDQSNFEIQLGKILPTFPNYISRLGNNLSQLSAPSFGLLVSSSESLLLSHEGKMCWQLSSYTDLLLNNGIVGTQQPLFISSSFLLFFFLPLPPPHSHSLLSTLQPRNLSVDTISLRNTQICELHWVFFHYKKPQL